MPKKRPSKIRNFFRKIFFLKSKTTEVIEEEDDVIIPRKFPKGIDRELEDLRNRLKSFLLTSKVKSGKVVEHQHFSITKNAPGLYKLEGTDLHGNSYSIVITTGSYLRMINGKLTGLLQLSEAEVNRAISKDHSSLSSFLDECKSLESVDLHNPEGTSRLSPNDICLLLVSLGDQFKKLFFEVASPKQRKIIMDELFYLNQGASSETANPHSKNKNWMNYEQALHKFQKVIDELLVKREKENVVSS